MLLHWCILEPSGPSNLASIRFSSPIRVHSIRVFPTDARPFAQNPDIIARTEPETFFLDVLFNAHPLHPVSQPELKEKQRAANALVPSVIAYAGGQMDFTVDMGTEYATRLMIIKGKFECVSLAIYGELVPESVLAVNTYQPRKFASLESLPLSRAIDPSNSSDPTLVARQLLASMPDSPPLSLVIRLMLCLKAPSEDWDRPEFPYLYADLDEYGLDFDLEKAFQCTTKPVQDDISYETLETFANSVADSIGPKSSSQAYTVAGIICNVASQHPDMARVLMQHLDLSSIFDAYNMDELTVLRLLDASSNIIIAQHLSNGWFLDMIRTIQTNPSVDKHTQSAARRLVARIRGWEILEDALSNTQADFNGVAGMIKDIGTEEQSFGIWLECMISHLDLKTKLAEIPVLPVPRSHSSLLGASTGSVTYDDFIAFVRTFIGVASVFAVYAWTDSLGNDRCRERTLGVLRLWQGVDGYKEIVNHLFLLRQMTFRLECITTDHDPPRRSGIHAEHILVDLAKEPRSILQRELIKCILSLRQPLSYITEDERLSLRKVALIADDGLPAAVEELTYASSHPMDSSRIRTLRVSLAIVEDELGDEKGEWRVFQALWDERAHGLVPHLVDIFVGVSDDLNGCYNLSSPPHVAQSHIEQLFRTATDLQRLIIRLALAYPLTTRSTRVLIAAVADVFVCTDAADMLYSQSSSACVAAQETRQGCIELVRCLSGPGVFAEPRKPGAEIVLRSLLEHGVHCDTRDPAYHLLQVFCLIDYLLPLSISDSEDARQSYWVTSIIPAVLPEMKSFFRVLDTENKVHFVKRLVNLDGGIIGIGEWLFIDELKHLSKALQSLDMYMTGEDRRLVGEHQAFLSLGFLLELITPPSSASAWCIAAITELHDASATLTNCLAAFVDGHMTSPYLSRLAEELATNSGAFDPSLRFAIVLTLFRAAQGHEISCLTADSITTPLHILKDIPEESIDIGRLQVEIGRTFSTLVASESALEKMNEEITESVSSVMEWLSAHHNASLTPLRGITGPSFARLRNRMRQTVPASSAGRIEAVLSKITVDEDESFMATITTLPESIELSVQNIKDLLQPPVPIPSTPKRNTPDILSLVTISPPTALLRSPAATGLTKTYSNNDFRQLRQLPSARQNTSRLPSMHVDVGINGHLT